MAGPAGHAHEARERFSVSHRPFNGRSGTALAGLASVSLICLLSLAALLHGGPFPDARAHPGAASPAAGQTFAAALSQALGAGDSAYRARPSLGGYQARNPAQHLRAHFSRGGVAFSSGALRVALALRQSGYGRAMRPV